MLQNIVLFTFYHHTFVRQVAIRGQEPEEGGQGDGRDSGHEETRRGED